MSKVKVLGYALVLTTIMSCSSGNRLYEDFQPINNSSWGMNDSLNFELGEIELPGSATLLAVKFNEEYAFSNCYLRVLSKDSAGVILDNKLVNIHLFNPKSGEPLGEGFGNGYTRYDTLPYDFPINTKSITLLQYMRQEQLPGVEAVGIKILK